MFFWLIYCKENPVGKIFIRAKNINHLFRIAVELMGTCKLHFFLLFEGTQIDDNEYLSSLEDNIQLLVSRENQIQKLLIYFALKRYIDFKNISYLSNINYLFKLWMLCISIMVAFQKC